MIVRIFLKLVMCLYRQSN